jgi:hypothetical protein
MMLVTLTRSLSATVIERADRDPAFARALLEEAVLLFHEGDARVARRLLKLNA